MADSNQNQILWGFLHYARSNPYSHLNSVHWDEIDAMAKLWCTVNLDCSNDTLTTTDPLSYGTEQDVPGPANDGSQLVDEAGISCATPTVNIYAGAYYPQRGYGG
jgi:hypothetical protein